MDLTRFKADPVREDDGVWAEIDSATGARVKIARIGNRRYREAMSRRLKPYRRALRNGTLDERVTERITAEVLAETVLLDWDGLYEGDRLLPYAPDTAKRILADDAYKDFRDLVVELASDLDLYREQELEEAEKNSAPSSPGSSIGPTSSTS